MIVWPKTVPAVGKEDNVWVAIVKCRVKFIIKTDKLIYITLFLPIKRKAPGYQSFTKVFGHVSIRSQVCGVASRWFSSAFYRPLPHSHGPIGIQILCPKARSPIASQSGNQSTRWNSFPKVI